MTADDIPIGGILRVAECGCEFTAVGHTDPAYPQHALFRHTKQTARWCRWEGTKDFWKFGDEPINRPGDIVLEIVG